MLSDKQMEAIGSYIESEKFDSKQFIKNYNVDEFTEDQRKQIGDMLYKKAYYLTRSMLINTSDTYTFRHFHESHNIKPTLSWRFSMWKQEREIKKDKAKRKCEIAAVLELSEAFGNESARIFALNNHIDMRTKAAYSISR